MMTLNNNEKDFQENFKRIQKMFTIVHERINQLMKIMLLQKKAITG